MSDAIPRMVRILKALGKDLDLILNQVVRARYRGWRHAGDHVTYRNDEVREAWRKFIAARVRWHTLPHTLYELTTP